MAKTFVILSPAAGSVKDVDALIERIRRLPEANVCEPAEFAVLPRALQFVVAAP
jgi:hypothetical protein